MSPKRARFSVLFVWHRRCRKPPQFLSTVGARMETPIWQIQVGDGPFVAAAIHDGNEVRGELHDHLEISPEDRLREEDPHTGSWTSIASTRIVAHRSRFEVDLNRPREKAVYLAPEDAWGLQVWKRPLNRNLVERSLASYDEFYADVYHTLQRLVLRHGRVVVFDLHTYNHRRNGPNGASADSHENPEINIGTGTMDRERWSPIVERCMQELGACDFHGRKLDVRENVKFRGGNFSKWIHETFPGSVCSIAIEFKKFFMDEWTGQHDADQVSSIESVLHEAALGAMEELGRFEPEPTATEG